MALFGRKQAFTILLWLGFVASAAAGKGPAHRTRPPADTMAVQHRLQIKKSSRWLSFPADSSDSFTEGKNNVLNQKRQSLISELEKVLRETKSEKVRIEMNLRLGRLYLEDYYWNLDVAHRNYQRALAEAGSEAKKKRLKVKTFRAEVALNKARGVYRFLLSKYAKDKRHDEMLYFYALTAVDKQQTKEAIKQLGLLVKRYPKSRYTQDALAQLGDFAFDANQYEKAEGYYTQILANKRNVLIPYAHYKKAWCAYNSQDPQSAITEFKWVIQNEQAVEGTMGFRLRKEAVRDIVLPFGDLKHVQKAIAFFHTLDPDSFRTGLEILAPLYFDRGDADSAVTIWEVLLDADPNHVKCAQYERRVFEALVHKNDADGALSRMEKILPSYLAGSEWAKVNRDKPESREAIDAFDETIKKQAFRYHEVAEKMNNPSQYQYARRLFELHLKSFPSSPSGTQVRYQYAALLFHVGEYIASSDEFFRVYQDPEGDSYRFKAISQALAALDKRLNQERKSAGLPQLTSRTRSKLTDDAGEEVVPYSDTETRYFKIAGEFLNRFPKTEEAPDVLYLRGYIEYRHHDFAKALGDFGQVLAKYTAHHTAESAGHLMLDIHNRRQDYPALIAASKDLLQKGPKGKPFRSQVEDVLRRAELKRIKLIEDQSLFAEAGENYLEYTKQYGYQDEALYEKALYNASVMFVKANDYGTAAQTLEKFLRVFPESRLKEKSIVQLAQVYESSGNLKRAAFYLNELSTKYPKNPQAQSALRLAGLYYWGTGDMTAAEKAMLSFVDRFPGSAATAERELIELYESQGKNDKIRKLHAAAREKPGVSPTDYVYRTLALADLQLAKTGKVPRKLMEEAHEWATKYRSRLRKTARGSEMLAKVLFWSLQDKEREFHALNLASRGKKESGLEQAIQKKLAMLKELEQNYAQIGAIGNEAWGLGAIYRSAAAHRQVAVEVMQAPPPARLGGAALETYQKETKEVVIDPFNQKALTLVAQCLNQAHELHILSHWTARCYSLGAEINPESYPVARTPFLPPLQTAVIPLDTETSKIPRGSTKKLSPVYLQSGLFRTFDSERRLASASPLTQLLLGGETRDLTRDTDPIPLEFDYRIVGADRIQAIDKAIESTAPDSDGVPSFAYLNYLRLRDPAKATELLQNALKKEPTNLALHNLLALSYLEAGKLTAAEVTWLSLQARGRTNPAFSNNLGVIAALKGKESVSISYFSEAMQAGESKEAARNLGFIALQHHNGLEAKTLFEKSMAIDKGDPTAATAFLISQIQTGETDSIEGDLVDLSKDHKSDPFARLAVSYFLIDVESKKDLAEELVSDYLKGRSDEEGGEPFKRLLRELKGDGGEIAQVIP